MRYQVRYTVNVQGCAEIDAASAAEAYRLVRKARRDQLDLAHVDSEEAMIHEVSPDDGMSLVDLSIDAQPAKRNKKKPALALVPDKPSLDDTIDAMLSAEAG